MTKIKIRPQKTEKIKIKTDSGKEINKLKIKTVTTREETVVVVVDIADGGTF